MSQNLLCNESEKWMAYISYLWMLAKIPLMPFKFNQSICGLECQWLSIPSVIVAFRRIEEPSGTTEHGSIAVKSASTPLAVRSIRDPDSSQSVTLQNRQRMRVCRRSTLCGKMSSEQRHKTLVSMLSRLVLGCRIMHAVKCCEDRMAVCGCSISSSVARKRYHA